MIELAGQGTADRMIVSYNGKSFDMPLLKTRFIMNRLAVPALPPHLDLVHLARRIHKARLKSHTLATIEGEVLGRGDHRRRRLRGRSRVGTPSTFST